MPLHTRDGQVDLDVGVLGEEGVVKQLFRRGPFVLPVRGEEWDNVGRDALSQEVEERFIDGLEGKQAFWREILWVSGRVNAHAFDCGQDEGVVVQLAVRMAAREHVNDRHAQCVDVHRRCPQTVGEHFRSVVADVGYA